MVQSEVPSTLIRFLHFVFFLFSFLEIDSDNFVFRELQKKEVVFTSDFFGAGISDATFGSVTSLL